MAKKAIMAKDKYMTKFQKILYEDIGKALLKYCKNGVGTIYVDDVKIDLFPSKGEWHKMSLYFKVHE